MYEGDAVVEMCVRVEDGGSVEDNARVGNVSASLKSVEDNAEGVSFSVVEVMRVGVIVECCRGDSVVGNSVCRIIVERMGEGDDSSVDNMYEGDPVVNMCVMVEEGGSVKDNERVGNVSASVKLEDNVNGVSFSVVRVMGIGVVKVRFVVVLPVCTGKGVSDAFISFLPSTE